MPKQLRQVPQHHQPTDVKESYLNIFCLHLQKKVIEEHRKGQPENRVKHVEEGDEHYLRFMRPEDNTEHVPVFNEFPMFLLFHFFYKVVGEQFTNVGGTILLSDFLDIISCQRSSRGQIFHPVLDIDEVLKGVVEGSRPREAPGTALEVVLELLLAGLEFIDLRTGKFHLL